MNFRKLMCLAVLGWTVTGAQAFEVCRAYEFAELQSFSTAELRDKYAEYKMVHDRIDTVAPANGREVLEDFNDQQKCLGEMERIKRVIDARAKEADVKPKASKKKAGG